MISISSLPHTALNWSGDQEVATSIAHAPNHGDPLQQQPARPADARPAELSTLVRSTAGAAARLDEGIGFNSEYRPVEHAI